MNNNDGNNGDLTPDLLGQAGISVTAKPTTDPKAKKLQELMLSFFADAASKAAVETEANEEIAREYAKHRADIVSHSLSSPHFKRVAQERGPGHDPNQMDDSGIDVVGIARDKAKLAQYFGSQSDPRMAAELARKSYPAYSFLRKKAQEARLTY
jgi:hypothetical protein